MLNPSISFNAGLCLLVFLSNSLAMTDIIFNFPLSSICNNEALQLILLASETNIKILFGSTWYCLIDVNARYIKFSHAASCEFPHWKSPSFSKTSSSGNAIGLMKGIAKE